MLWKFILINNIDEFKWNWQVASIFPNWKIVYMFIRKRETKELNCHWYSFPCLIAWYRCNFNGEKMLTSFSLHFMFLSLSICACTILIKNEIDWQKWWKNKKKWNQIEKKESIGELRIKNMEASKWEFIEFHSNWNGLFFAFAFEGKNENFYLSFFSSCVFFFIVILVLWFQLCDFSCVISVEAIDVEKLNSD